MQAAQHPVDQHVSRIGTGIISLYQVPELQQLLNITSLCLHANNITRIEGLERARSAASPPLSIKQNQLRKLQDFAVLVGCIKLRELHVDGNPVCQVPNYRQALASVLPQITQLDSLNSAEALAEPYDMHAARQHATASLHAFEQQWTSQPSSSAAPSPSLAMPHPHNMQHQAQQWVHQHQEQPPVHTQQPQQQQHRATPQVDVILAGFHRRWQQQQQQPSEPNHHTQQPLFTQLHGQGVSQPAHTPSAHPLLNSQTTSTCTAGITPALPARQPANWQTTGKRQQQRTHEPGVDRTEPGHTTLSVGSPSKGPARPPGSTHASNPRTDAAVQTQETAAALRALQTEATELQDQLRKMTDELARRNSLEEESSSAMAAAISGAEQAAHLQVEVAYKEASHAVERALQEVEAARRQASDSSERAVLHSKYEEEYKTRCLSLEKDIHRLREDVQKGQVQLEGQAQSAASSLAELRQMSQLAGHTAQQELNSASAELAACRAAASAADHRVLVLEAALQQSSAVTLSLTTQIAQAMAEASTQSDQLKGRIAALDHQTSELQRRDTDSRAEINILTAAMAAAQQRHQQEVKEAHSKHQESLATAIVRERGIAEERGKGSMLLAAQQERAVMQEQLTFLKVQMQYALKESEGELAAAHEQIQRAVADAAELRSALVAANLQHQEHEALVEEFIGVVTQQKAHMQVLQQDLQLQQKRLSECTPERLDALVAENAALKRSCDELQVQKEQVEHYRGLWLGANKKNAELEVASTHAIEDGKMRCAGLESSLAAAREEARHACKEAEKQAALLIGAQDGFKIKTAMLDSANETVAALKADVADLSAELDEARRCTEESEQQFRRMHDQGEQERASLRSEIEAGESALEGMESGSSDALSKCKEAEARLKVVEDALAEKDGMIKYVGEEVERVKGMFEKREARLRDERDAARTACDAASSECNTLLARVALLPELSMRSDALAAELESSRSECVTAHAAAKAASAAAAIAGAEALQMGARLAEVEDEMQGLLGALERQKAVSASKMQQLTMLLQDL
ncbi:MAG: hypothetical protein WDW38_003219 [Sanguina aurantia]